MPYTPIGPQIKYHEHQLKFIWRYWTGKARHFYSS